VGGAPPFYLGILAQKEGGLLPLWHGLSKYSTIKPQEKKNDDIKANYQSCYHAIRNDRHAVLRFIVAISSRRNGLKYEKQRRRCYLYQ
jgi:hypothetical protein